MEEVTSARETRETPRSPRRGPAARLLGGCVVLALCASCEVVKEVGRDTVKVVDTVALVDTLVRTDTVFVDDSLAALGDEIAATALAALVGDSGAGAGGAAPRTPALPATPAGTGATSAGGAATGAPAAGATLARTDSAALGDTVRPVVTGADLSALRAKRLLVPVVGVPAAKLPDTFNERRGSRRHEALDILAPRGTPVVATDSGRVFKLFTSKAGGLTLYATDPSGQFMYYYAHLDSYDPRAREGATLRRGDTLGFVGTTGNAAPNVPHLHFAIARIADLRQWWKGAPINPQPLLTDAR